MLENKKILFIGLDYHNYTSEMISVLRDNNFDVTYYSLKPRKLKHKIIQTLHEKTYNSFVDSYHKGILEKEKNNSYDYVFFLQVHFMKMDIFLKLKKKHTNSKFILYNWDAIKTHDYSPYIIHFNEVYTFDPADAKDLNVNYLPLFCVSKFQNLRKIEQNLNSVYFVGNIVSIERYRSIQDFKKLCAANDISFSYFMKCSPVIFLKLLLNGFLPFDVRFFNISNKKFIHLVSNSNTVFDFSNHIQMGHTMRFIENLCAGKKIITNSKNSINEDYYSDNRILYIEKIDSKKILDFIRTPLQNEDKDFSEFYVQNFLQKLFN